MRTDFRRHPLYLRGDFRGHPLYLSTFVKKRTPIIIFCPLSFLMKNSGFSRTPTLFAGFSTVFGGQGKDTHFYLEDKERRQGKDTHFYLVSFIHFKDFRGHLLYLRTDFRRHPLYLRGDFRGHPLYLSTFVKKRTPIIIFCPLSFLMKNWNANATKKKKKRVPILSLNSKHNSYFTAGALAEGIKTLPMH